MSEKRFVVFDGKEDIVAGLRDVPAANALIRMLVPQKPLDELKVCEKTLARDRLGVVYTVVRLLDKE